MLKLYANGCERLGKGERHAFTAVFCYRVLSSTISNYFFHSFFLFAFCRSLIVCVSVSFFSFIVKESTSRFPSIAFHLVDRFSLLVCVCIPNLVQIFWGTAVFESGGAS